METFFADNAYEELLQDLDQSYVRVAGEAVRARLFPTPNLDGLTPVALPAALNYQPGNGTVYALVFTSVRSIRQLDQEVAQDPRGVPEGCFEAQEVDPKWVLVAKVNGTGDDFVCPFDLSFGRAISCRHVAQATELKLPDATPITALLRAIAGAELTD